MTSQTASRGRNAALTQTQTHEKLSFLQVFRSLGYEGATLSSISEATGLGKASLYHHFPKGKEQMAKAVLQLTGDWVGENIVALLREENLSPEKKIKLMVERVSAFYGHGKEACVLEALLHGDAAQTFQAEIKKGLGKWTDALVDVLMEAGVSKAKARQNAEDMFVKIQGSLIISRAMKNTDVFRRTMTNLPAALLETR